MTPVRVALLSRSDGEGGAGQAAYRLFQGLAECGTDVSLEVQKALRGDPRVAGPNSRYQTALALLRPQLDQLPLAFYRCRKPTAWSPALLPSYRPRTAQGDVIHLHWINGGMLSVRGVGRLDQPVVWTMHDAWAFTGGCHFSYECRRYTDACGACPQLGSSSRNDLSHILWRQKQKHWSKLNLTVVAPSSWLADRARESSLLGSKRIVVLPNGLNMQVFKPIDKQQARFILNLPEKKNLLLFGAFNAAKDPRKGMVLLREATRILAEKKEIAAHTALVVFGAAKAGRDSDLPLQSHYLGSVRDEFTMAMAYSAADAFVLPSLADNLPYTVMEALACGTPCIGFRVGGVPEMIAHRQTGYVAEPGDAADLARGIEWLLTHDQESRRRLGSAARDRAVRNYDIRHIASAHLDLYQSVLTRPAAAQQAGV